MKLSNVEICYLLAAICFAVGWLGPVVFVSYNAQGQRQPLWVNSFNWLCGGLFFIAVSLLL